jgi:predicted nucleic acid-binding Zn ribbon protein
MRYEFECSKCDGYFEVDIRLSVYEEIFAGTKPPPACKTCKTPLKRIITKAPNFKLLGHGWYADGYGITDMEMKQNNDNDMKFQLKHDKAVEKDSNIKEV